VVFGVVTGSRALTEFRGALSNPITRAARVGRSSGPRSGLSVLGLACHTRAPPNHRTSRLCLCPPLSAGSGIREVSGRKNESSLWQVPH